MMYRKDGRAGTRRSGMGLMLAGLLAATTAATTIAYAAVDEGHKPGHAAMDPAAMDRHLEEMIGKMLPDATPEQRSKLIEKMRAFHGDMQAFHTGMKETHARMLDLVQQPRIDRAAMERLRVEQMRRADAASAQMVKSLADAAETLNPDQRARLIAQMKTHMPMH
jgi:Spy/CpxP family protein refolding chaperone